jgi:hypothetical protein
MQRRTLLRTLTTVAAPLLASPALAWKADAPNLPPHNEIIRCFTHNWLVRTAEDWKTETAADGEVLHLNVPRPQEANPRAPVQYALLESQPLGCFTLDVELRSDIKSVSLIIVYAWKDPIHFDYVHLSTDAARQQPVHNGVFHVYGGDRVRISNDEGSCALANPSEWTHVRLVYDESTHMVETWINGQLNPSLRAADFSLGAGLIGLGSFFNAGSFRNFGLRSGVCRPS